MTFDDGADVFAEHDHRACCRDAVARLRETAKRRGLRLTPLRLRVMELLTEAHRATGAYDILDRLREEGLAQAPPQVYRALDFLVEHGFAHRIERLNAFVACGQPDGGHETGAAFLICGNCRRVAEIDDPELTLAVASAAAARGFAIDRAVMELGGTCPACRERR